MRKSVVTLACLFFISACKPSDNYVISLGENLVKDKLIDPDSAKFNSFFISQVIYMVMFVVMLIQKTRLVDIQGKAIFCLFGSCGWKS